MSRTTTRAFLITGGALLAVALVLTLTKDNGTEKPKPAQAEPVTVTVKDGKPAGGVKSVSVSSGQTVRITVDSDVADDVHVHGYDKQAAVTPGTPVTLSFPATMTGRFEVELEQRAEPLLNLVVEP